MFVTMLFVNLLKESLIFSDYIKAILMIFILYFFKVHIFKNIRIKSNLPCTEFKRDYIRGSGDDIKCYNPNTGECYKTVQAYTKNEVINAIKRSRKAQLKWT